MPAGNSPRVLATTNIVADIVSAVGGPRIALHELLPRGADPHSFIPSPIDLEEVSQADLIFVNGAGLEYFLEHLLENIASSATIVSLADSLPSLLQAQSSSHADAHAHEGHHHPEMVDPHVWLDPLNVSLWVPIIVSALSRQDTSSALWFESRGDSLSRELEKLDQWMNRELAAIGESRRILVTDHAAFGYFARRYGFTCLGSAIPGFNTLAEPSARDIARLEDAIRRQRIPAIFIEANATRRIAERVAEDTGLRVIPLYIGTLTGDGGAAPTYISLMRYNTLLIADALTGGEQDSSS